MLKLLRMARRSFDCDKTYRQVSRDLKNALSDRETLDIKILKLRRMVHTIAIVCESEGIEVVPSLEAVYLLEAIGLPDEIVSVLKAEYPESLSVPEIKQRLERIGRDMSKYRNPLATIHMVLKRLLGANPRRIQQVNGTKTTFCAPREISELCNVIHYEAAQSVSEFMDKPQRKKK